MKAWIKGAIVGGIWGLVASGIPILYYMYEMKKVELLMVTLGLPTKILFLIGIKWSIVIIIPSILIGALICSGIGYLIDKYRAKKVEKGEP